MNLLGLPVGANPDRDIPWGTDELGNPQFRASNGTIYSIRQNAIPQRQTEPGTLARAGEVGKEYIGGAIQSLFDAVTAPRRALSGEGVMYGDALNTAGMLQLGGAASMGRGVMDYDPNTVRAFFSRDGGTIDDALNLARSGDAIFHSGNSSLAEDIHKYGVEPTNDGAWIREVAAGAVDDVDEFLSQNPSAAWWSDAPNWVRATAARAAGKHVNDMTLSDIEKFGHLSIARGSDWGDEVFRIPESGLDNGEYSYVQDLLGNNARLYETPLFEYGDDNVGRYPFGIERNELVTASNIDPEYTLTGKELVDFLSKYDPSILSANRDATAAAIALPVARNESEAMARQILEMRAQGRAKDVTDAMMAQADPQYMYANTPLPMDYESRMARADQYFPDTAYHSTGRDFQKFIPSEFRGASFFGSTPEGASRGASASANEGVGSGSTITMPVRVDTSRVEGLGAYGRKDMNEFRAALPDRVYTEAEVDALMASDMAPRYGDWTDFFDDLTDYDALRKFRDENSTAPIPEGIVKFRPKQRLSYGPGLRSNMSGKQFAHYSEGMSERPISDYTKSIGNTGFTMMDESGLALAMTDPSLVRSRFARFDPEFSHLANLNAANVSPEVGLLATQPTDADKEAIMRYLGAQGLLR